MKGINLGEHDRVRLYIVFWFLITVLFIIFFSITTFNKTLHTCKDGTQTYNEAECVQCVLDTDCNADQRCSTGKCVARECDVDTDCVVLGNECIFGTCRNNAGYSTNVAPSEDGSLPIAPEEQQESEE